jgi:hypothetical protein
MHMYRLPTPPCPLKTVVEPCCFIASNLFRQDSDSKQPEDLPPRTMDLVSGGLAHYLCVAHVGSLPVFASTKVFGCRLVIRAGAATYWQPCYTHLHPIFWLFSHMFIFSYIFPYQNRMNLMSTCHSTNSHGNEIGAFTVPFCSGCFSSSAICSRSWRFSPSSPRQASSAVLENGGWVGWVGLL